MRYLVATARKGENANINEEITYVASDREAAEAAGRTNVICIGAFQVVSGNPFPETAPRATAVLKELREPDALIQWI
ncbi:MAG: hypothetical protein ABFD54_10405 [Armatimonadota bacterium]|nr:hypothetical protein [bacterium]